ncbi:LPS translocon maturation chaperone LptM [Limnohabitans radicicola]|uniref:Lipoprotein n=1 Tax=Limnohabitans radicicola TaxID=2771427 RepID=A0A927FF94_9BURK|nr:lipoprotein [Limnohabitans radicicola]MBD8049472.1 lipoprotein [Limnohabitans radicicola]
MLRVLKILVIAQVLAACAAMLAACGQKGPLVLPQTPESVGRATLPQTLNPWRQPGTPTPSAVPASPAAASASDPAR